jgi:DNA-binding transcriptional regulator YhcF (GntR family)
LLGVIVITWEKQSGRLNVDCGITRAHSRLLKHTAIRQAQPDAKHIHNIVQIVLDGHHFNQIDFFHASMHDSLCWRAEPMMLFHVEKNSTDTYYEQIRGQLVLHLLCSNLNEGDKLPTIREAARMLHINANTVFKIYRRLEADKLLDIRHGSGVYVGRSLYGTNKFNQDLLQFIAGTFRQAEARFNFPPRVFANLMYRYISKTGSVDELYLVINDDETKDIDAGLLSARFSCHFRPFDLQALECPSASVRHLIRETKGYITTKFHLDRVAKYVRSSDKIIEIRRDARFVGDALEAATHGEVLVMFKEVATSNHFRDLVFRKLYPAIASNISCASLDEKAVVEKMIGKSRIFASPLCYEAVRKLAPVNVEVTQIEGWISRQSMENIRALLLYSDARKQAAAITPAACLTIECRTASPKQ